MGLQEKVGECKRKCSGCRECMSVCEGTNNLCLRLGIILGVQEFIGEGVSDMGELGCSGKGVQV